MRRLEEHAISGFSLDWPDEAVGYLARDERGNVAFAERELTSRLCERLQHISDGISRRTLHRGLIVVVDSPAFPGALQDLTTGLGFLLHNETTPRYTNRSLQGSRTWRLVKRLGPGKDC